MILREVCNILNGGQDYCRERGEQRNDDVVKKPRFSTDRVVVEAVGSVVVVVDSRVVVGDVIVVVGVVIVDVIS